MKKEKKKGEIEKKSRLTQAVEHLPSKLKALSSNPQYHQKKKRK
jgi:hypothetical protein